MEQASFLLKVHHEQSVAIFRRSNGADLNLSWLEHSHLNGLSADGNTLLTSEIGEGGGDLGSVYLRKTDGSPATRLCSGVGIAISPDVKWALARPGVTGYELVPTGAGQSYSLQFPSGASAKWFPDGNHITLTLNTEQGSACYVQDLREGSPSGPPRPIANLNMRCAAVSSMGNTSHPCGWTSSSNLSL